MQVKGVINTETLHIFERNECSWDYGKVLCQNRYMCVHARFVGSGGLLLGGTTEAVTFGFPAHFRTANV